MAKTTRTPEPRPEPAAGDRRRAGSAPPALPDADLMRRMFQAMWLIRRFEERAAEEYMKGHIGGFLHLAIGEEAAVVGTIAALRDDDPVTSTYREHGQALARGSDPGAVMAELFGRQGGICGGRGGSMHLMDAARHFYGGYGIVGGSIPLGVGLAFASAYRDEDRVSLTMFGDGAINQGVVAESMNMAELWRLPVVFFCLNNQYGMGTALERHSAEPDLFKRAEAYGMPTVQVNGMDVLAVYDAVSEAARLAREERQPSMIEAVAYRYRGHSMSDPDTVRDADEKQRWQARDPLLTFERILLGEGVLTREDVAEVVAGAERAVEEAVAFAEASPPVPEEELARHVYATPWSDDARGDARMPS
ncbi:MAG: pyruvate dehydrogenase (acetyl-transferring) E1 component subunit alpha [Actinomycetota bacterium]